jgi:uncharacterized OB-fold protein
MDRNVTSTTNDRLLEAVLKVGGDPADMPFWLACADGKFLVHRCGHCGKSYWPASRCTHHGDAAMSWVEASGKAALHTYTILHHAYIPAMKDKVPFVVGVVQLAEGPFYHTNILECDHDKLEIGMPLSVKMESHESGLTLPMFIPALVSA